MVTQSRYGTLALITTAKPTQLLTHSLVTVGTHHIISSSHSISTTHLGDWWDLGEQGEPEVAARYSTLALDDTAMPTQSRYTNLALDQSAAHKVTLLFTGFGWRCEAHAPTARCK
jgi:hypothetical protein